MTTASTRTTSSIREEANDDECDDTEYVELVIEGRIFYVTRYEIRLFDSFFLNKLVNQDDDSPFCKPAIDNVYVIHDRNPTYFEAFFHVLTPRKRSSKVGYRHHRGGGIPEILKYHLFETNKEGGNDDGGYYDNKLTKYLLQEADYWGVKERVEHYMYVEVPTAACLIQRTYRMYKKKNKKKKKKKETKNGDDTSDDDVPPSLPTTTSSDQYCWLRGTCWVCGNERWGYRPVEANWNPYKHGVNIPRYPPPGVCETCSPLDFWNALKFRFQKFSKKLSPRRRNNNNNKNTNEEGNE